MFQRKTKYYTGVVFEWNLPTGWTCPGASGCLVRVDKETGKADNRSTEYRCYSASAERFPGVRESRWDHFNTVNGGEIPELPEKAGAVRVHASGDFFSQAYFDKWLAYCARHPEVDFWAYTKSIPYWIKRVFEIPRNFVLTASIGGKFDTMALDAGLRTATVIQPDDVRAGSGLVDTNDDLARKPGPSFYLLDNDAAKVKRGEGKVRVRLDAVQDTE
jgi:hypothetical protein